MPNDPSEIRGFCDPDGARRRGSFAIVPLVERSDAVDKPQAAAAPFAEMFRPRGAHNLWLSPFAEMFRVRRFLD